MSETVRVVADADVLAGDLLVGASAREALDIVRSHSWIELVASNGLLDDAEEIIAGIATAELASDWRETIEEERVAVEHPPKDHPAIASAYHGDAAHILSFDESLRSAKTGMKLRERMDVSVKAPDAFSRLFDPERIYESIFEEPYPGPDRSPR